jgi:(E)-4-hydroxy-3-methylbut-2-enyl-diphosphate synthase
MTPTSVLWCSPNYVNLKRGNDRLGTYSYDEILPQLKAQLNALIAQRMCAGSLKVISPLI